MTTMTAQSNAQASLTILEQAFLKLPEHEQQEINLCRHNLRNLVQYRGSSAELAIVAISFEIAIKERQ